jgi:HlyD family secretion protein
VSRQRRILIAVIGVALVLAAVGAYELSRPHPAAPLVGIVRATEIRIAPEVGGQLSGIKVKKGDHVRTDDAVAELSAVELTAAVEQARATLAAAVASRANVLAGERPEQVATLAAEIAKIESRLTYAKSQLARATYLARKDFVSAQSLDQAENDVATARADLAEAEANHALAKAGPTKEQRAIADAQVLAAEAGLTVLERRLDKTILRAPADGVVSVIVAEVGEAIRAGQPVLAIDVTGGQWLSFNVREDDLLDLTMGATVDVSAANADKPIPALVTEILPLGTFATWQAERAVGDHDRNTLRLRLDLKDDATRLEPGMAIWLSR